MRWRHMVAGALGITAAVAWATLMVAEAPRYLVATRIVTGSGEPLLLRLFVLPAMVQGIAGALLVIPMAITGVAVMLRVRKAATGLRGMALAGFATAGSVVLVFGGIVLTNPGVGPRQLGMAAQLELVGAAALLLLHGATALALSSPRALGQQPDGVA